MSLPFLLVIAQLIDLFPYLRMPLDDGSIDLDYPIHIMFWLQCELLLS